MTSMNKVSLIQLLNSHPCRLSNSLSSYIVCSISVYRVFQCFLRAYFKRRPFVTNEKGSEANGNRAYKHCDLFLVEQFIMTE